MKLTWDVFHKVDNDHFSNRENDLLLKKPTLYRAFNQLSRQIFKDVPEACDSIINAKERELLVLQDQFNTYQALVDFMLADKESFTLSGLDLREHPRCQGKVVQAQRNSSLVVRQCNELCTLKNASYERIKELEDEMSTIVQRSI